MHLRVGERGRRSREDECWIPATRALP
jgi:hypothetical protein